MGHRGDHGDGHISIVHSRDRGRMVTIRRPCFRHFHCDEGIFVNIEHTAVIAHLTHVDFVHDGDAEGFALINGEEIINLFECNLFIDFNVENFFTRFIDSVS